MKNSKVIPEQLVYKVVSCIADGHYNTKRYSAIRNCPYRMEYKINETVIPQIGKLFAFSTVMDARSFIYDEVGDSPSNLEIWESLGTGIEIGNKILYPTDIMNVGLYSLKTDNIVIWGRLHRFWNNKLTNMHLINASEGSITCESIKLIKRRPTFDNY